MTTVTPADLASSRPAADLLWPRPTGIAAVARAVLIGLVGAGILTLSAKVQVPGPVPTTLQTLAALALGAVLGQRLAVFAFLLYLGEGLAGFPVFAGTPPIPAGLPYLLGPTGGYLLGMLLTAALVGFAADRGLARTPALFAAVLVAAGGLNLAFGWAWLAFGMPVHGSFGIGALRAFQVGVAPFALGEAVKVALAAVALPTGLSLMRRHLRG